jgi:hypothetical protein
VGEALKAANIDIVGGESDFFEKVVKAVSAGKAVDRLVGNSNTLTDIKNTFFNGDSDHFRNQVRKWVDDFGIKTEDLKNLTIAALLAKMISPTDDSALKSLMKSALTLAKDSGLGDTPATSVMTKQPASV